MTTIEARVELEDWLHERERERPRRATNKHGEYYAVPYDARTDALKLAIRLLHDGEASHGQQR